MVSVFNAWFWASLVLIMTLTAPEMAMPGMTEKPMLCRETKGLGAGQGVGVEVGQGGQSQAANTASRTKVIALPRAKVVLFDVAIGR